MEALINILQHSNSPQMMFNIVVVYWIWRTERRVFKIELWLKYYFEKMGIKKEPAETDSFFK